jgi:hypothetical protein
MKSGLDQASPASPATSGRRSRSGRTRPSETGNLFTAVLVFSLPLAYYALRARSGVGLPDEGYIVSLAARVQSGEIPYRDFFTLYPPTIYYLLAALFDVFGATLITARLLVAFVKALNLVLAWFIVRDITRSRWSLLAPAGILGLDLVDGAHLIAYPAPLSEALVLLAWLVLVRWLRSGRAWLPAAAGVCCSLAFAFKQPQGAVVALAVLVWLFSQTDQPRKEQRRWPVLIFPAVVALLAIPLAVSSSRATLLFLVPPGVALGIRAWHTRSSLGFLQRRPVVLFLLGAFAAASVFAVVGMIVTGPAYFVRGVFLDPLVESGFRFSPDAATTLLGGTEALLALYLVAFLAAVIATTLPSSVDQRSGSGIQLGLLIAGFLAWTLYPVPSSTRALWISEPFVALLVISILICVICVRRRRVADFLTPGLITILVVVTLVVDPGGRVTRWVSRLGATADLNLAVDCLRASGDEEEFVMKRAGVCFTLEGAQGQALVRAAARIRHDTETGDRVFVFPSGAVLYFLSGRMNSGRYESLDVKSTARLMPELVEMFENSPPKLVVEVSALNSARSDLAGLLGGYEDRGRIGPYHFYGPSGSSRLLPKRLP